MSQEARYFRVGLFVLVGAALTVAGLLALGAGKFLQRPVVFETVFDESVQGLEIGSPMKFRGVTLGRVSDIGTLDEFYEPKTAEEVARYEKLILVRFEIPPEMVADPTDMKEQGERLHHMIDRGLRLRITPLGITGTNFVDSDYVDPSTPTIAVTWDSEYLYVPSTPSTLRTFSVQFADLLKRLDQFDFEAVLHDLDALIQTVRGAVGDLDLPAFATEGKATLGELQATLNEFQSVLAQADFAGVVKKANQTLTEADQTLQQVRRAVDGGGYDLEVTLENLRVTTENLRDLTNTLREQPSLLLRSAPPSR